MSGNGTKRFWDKFLDKKRFRKWQTLHNGKGTFCAVNKVRTNILKVSINVRNFILKGHLLLNLKLDSAETEFLAARSRPPRPRQQLDDAHCSRPPRPRQQLDDAHCSRRQDVVVGRKKDSIADKSWDLVQQNCRCCCCCCCRRRC